MKEGRKEVGDGKNEHHGRKGRTKIYIKKEGRKVGTRGKSRRSMEEGRQAGRNEGT
jgi:hypothetical protein